MGTCPGIRGNKKWSDTRTVHLYQLPLDGDNGSLCISRRYTVLYVAAGFIQHGFWEMTFSNLVEYKSVTNHHPGHLYHIWPMYLIVHCSKITQIYSFEGNVQITAYQPKFLLDIFLQNYYRPFLTASPINCNTLYFGTFIFS